MRYRGDPGYWSALFLLSASVGCSGTDNSGAGSGGRMSGAGGKTSGGTTSTSGGNSSGGSSSGGSNAGGSANGGSTSGGSTSGGSTSGGNTNSGGSSMGGGQSTNGGTSAGGMSGASQGGGLAQGGMKSAGGSSSGGTTSSNGGATSGGTNSGTGGANSSGAGGVPTGGNGFYQMERLNRGVVAVQVSGGIYVGWRMFGFEYDAQNPANVSYNVYRGGAKIATVTNSTNYLDASGTSTSQYTVRAVIGGTEGANSESATPWAQNYLRIPLTQPSSIYSANDGSVGDADGDGVYEIFLKWEPNDAKDNSQAGVTSSVFIDAIRMNSMGTRLWRIDLGPNIRAGAHYTQFVVYDFDGDGKAELACKTAPGTKDGTGAYLHTGPAANDNDSTIYRNADGYVLSGPEYLTVFNGQTGAEMATVAFDVPRGTVSSWGDGYGNRVDRFLGAAAYLDDSGLASFIMARGYYTRTTLTAWNFRNGTLSQLWKFDSNQTPNDGKGHSYTGQGSHSMTIANADDDPGQEVMYGAMEVDHNGKGLCSTGYNHGDAEHAGDLVPSRPGIEFFMCNEDGSRPAYHVRDTRTCEIIQQGPVNGADTGRCVAGDILASNPGAEMWASSTNGLISSTTNANVGNKPGSSNFLIYWDADETRELEDGTSITKYGGSSLLSCSQCASNNGTKSTPTLTADLLGDWREEIIWRESNNTGLRLYTTTAVTTRRIYTLMHDPQYRMQVTAEQTAYNQPPHPGFHIGSGMAAPPVPNIKVK